MTPRVLTLAALAVGLSPLLGWALAPSAPDEALVGLVVGYALAGVPFAALVYGWRGWPEGARGLLLMLGLAALVRLILLPIDPLLSEDAWRYLWDGLVQHNGINPYRWAPDASALDALMKLPGYAAVRVEIGHAEVPTIYPPVAQIAFYLGAALGPHLLAIRGLMIGADLLAIAGLWRLAEARDLPPQLALLYAFAPITVMESAVGGHVDALGVAGVIWAAALLAQHRPHRGAIALAAAIGAKLLPLMVLPTLLRRHPKSAILAVLALICFALPYMDAGPLALRGLKAYGRRWRGNDGAFAVLAAPFELIWSDPRTSFAAAKLLFIGLFGLVWLRSALHATRIESVLGPSLAALFLLAPVVYPWYLTWVIAFAALAHAQGPRPWTWAIYTWVLTAWLAYLPRVTWLAEAQWREPVWSRVLEYAPVWGVLAFAAWRGVHRQPDNPAHSR